MSRHGEVPTAPTGWNRWMAEIRAEFGYGEEADRGAAQRLSELLVGVSTERAWGRARALLENRTVGILGAADSAVEDLRAFPMSNPLMAADGAATAARQMGRVPDVLVTDLDGRMEDEVWAAERGAMVAVHAHGDNLDLLERWVPRFPKDRLMGTCQVEPTRGLANPGGFTDGDRACFLAWRLGAARVELLGFDLLGGVGRFAGARHPEATRRKLAWCARILDYLREEAGGGFVVGPRPRTAPRTQDA